MCAFAHGAPDAFARHTGLEAALVVAHVARPGGGRDRLLAAHRSRHPAQDPPQGAICLKDRAEAGLAVALAAAAVALTGSESEGVALQVAPTKSKGSPAPLVGTVAAAVVAAAVAAWCWRRRRKAANRFVQHIDAAGAAPLSAVMPFGATPMPSPLTADMSLELQTSYSLSTGERPLVSTPGAGAASGEQQQQGARV